MAGCGQTPETVVVTRTPATPTSDKPVAPTTAPAAAPVGAAPTPVAAAPSAPKPQAAAAPASPGPVGKAMYQMDARHTGRSPLAGPREVRSMRTFDTFRPGFELEDVGDPRPNIESSASVAPDGAIYIGTFPGYLFALRDPGGGERLEMRWRFHPPGASSFHGTPAIGPDGTVYLGFSTGGATPQARGAMYALQAPESGTEARVLWTVELGPGRQTASPTLGPDGTVYAVSGSGALSAIAPDGTVRWTAATGPSLKAAPALGPDGTVYLASMDGHLYAVAPPTGAGREGAVRWRFNFGQHLGPTPLVTASVPPPGADGVGSGASPTVGSDGTIYVGANNSNFYAVGPDGALRWLYEAERDVAGIWSTAALGVDESTLYFGANKGGIYALDRQDGRLRWQFAIPGSVYNSPLLDSRGVLYTGSDIGHVLGIDVATGRAVFDHLMPGGVWTAPAIAPNGSLVVATRGGQVAVLAA